METFNGLRLAQAHHAELVAQAARHRLVAPARSGRRARLTVLARWARRTAPPAGAEAITAGCGVPAGAC